ncbi:sodium:solute symporter family protein [bacterium]|nr:sodium:solute symporter family protein [bacterium]
MIDLHPIDLVILGGYFVYLMVVAYATRHQSRGDESSYLLAGRSLTVPAFVATLVSTWYGGILGVGEYSFSYGISNWLVFGVPYYLAAGLFALLLAKRARNEMVLSIPDQLEKKFGRGPALIGAGMVFIMTVPAAYVLMIGVLLQAFLGGSLALWVIVGTLFSTVYVAFGGFRSVIRTDLVQFILMYTSFILLLVLTANKYGGFDFLQANLPTEHLSWNGGMPVGSILVWYVIAMATLVEPSFYQRCYAAKSAKVARSGILISILFWGVFDFLTTFSGLYARAVLAPDSDPMLSFPLLASQVLPQGLLGLFLLGLLAVIMSTVDSYSFIAAQTLGRDLVARARNQLGEWNAHRIQWSLLATAAGAILIALWKGSAVTIWHDLGAIGTPVLLLPLALSFNQRLSFRNGIVMLSMLSGGFGALAWTFFGSYETGYPAGIDPIFIGLFTSLIPLLAGLRINRE